MNRNQRARKTSYTAQIARSWLIRYGYSPASADQYLGDALLGGFAYPIGPVRKITFHARTQGFTFQFRSR